MRCPFGRLGILAAVVYFFFVYSPVRLSLPVVYLRTPASAFGTAAFAAAQVSEGHSHNDYLQTTPLFDALANRFYSVEADVWRRDGELKLSHLGIEFVGGLRELYLEPLQHLVNRLGSVYGDGKRFILWIELKENDPLLVQDLQKMLSRYPMLTRFNDRTVIPGPVTVVLTGVDSAKRAYVSLFSDRYACRDSQDFSYRDPPLDNRWCWYTLSWADYFSWDGNGVMPKDQLRDLRRVVAAVHATGKKLRIYDAPDTPAIWQSEYDAGVDLIGTDSVQKFGSWHDLQPGVVTVRADRRSPF